MDGELFYKKKNFKYLSASIAPAIATGFEAWAQVKEMCIRDREITINTPDGPETIPQAQPAEYGLDYVYDDNGIMLDETGAPVMTEVLMQEERPSEIPIYKPNIYPCLLYTSRCV